MAAGDLTSRAVVKEFTTIGANVDTLIDRLVTASSEIIKRLTSRRLVKATYTSEFYDGDRAGKGRTELWLREFPVNSVVSVKENGNALVVATGYNPTADVLLVGQEGYLIRQIGTTGTAYYRPGRGAGWAPGRQNIELTYTAGWDYPRVGTAGVAPWLDTDLPFDIEQAATELTVLLFNERNRIGDGGKTFEKWTVNYIRKLNPAIADVISAYERGFRTC